MKIRSGALGASLAWSLGSHAALRVDLAPCAPPHAPALCVVGEDERGAFAIPLERESSEPFVDRHLRLLRGGPTNSRLASVHFAAHHPQGKLPAISVVDLTRRRVLGTARAPHAGVRSFVAYLQGPEGERPVLAPGLGDTPGPHGWGYLCLFRGERVSARGSRCGVGFTEASTFLTPRHPLGSHREVGGLTGDADGDGWEDLDLIFHGEVATYSGRTAQLLARTAFDVAGTRPGAKAGVFHSGRNYGVLSLHRSKQAEESRLRLVGGIPVGDFDDPYCNVSRFAAVLQSPSARPRERRLAWSRYYGFHSTTLAPASLMNSPSEILREGDGMNGCIHRFSDATVTLGREELLVFNVFEASAKTAPCVSEQRRLLTKPAWSSEKKAAWETCLRTSLGTRGRWRTEWLRESDGQPLPGPALKSSYLWGWVDGFHSRGESVYFFEKVPPESRYDLRDAEPSPLFAYAYRGGAWVEVGRSPRPARPALRRVSAEGSRGVGSDTYLAELEAQDVDADGRPDIRLASGDWLGFGQESLTLKRNPRPAPASR